MFNKVFLIGRLTRDPEIRFLPSGSQITAFSIAVNRKYKVNDQWKEETSFFDIETFGPLAERVGKQLSKGMQVLIEGQLKQDRWETSSGEKRSKIKVVASKITNLSLPKEGPKEEKAEESEEGEVADIELPPIDDIADDEDVPF